MLKSLPPEPQDHYYIQTFIKLRCMGRQTHNETELLNRTMQCIPTKQQQEIFWFYNPLIKCCRII